MHNRKCTCPFTLDCLVIDLQSIIINFLEYSCMLYLRFCNGITILIHSFGCKIRIKLKISIYEISYTIVFTKIIFFKFDIIAHFLNQYGYQNKR